MAVTKVISGGQIGADIAALRAAKVVGLETGGWAPKGWRTIEGANLDLRDVYGLVEHDDYRYPPRTFANVKESDGTLRIARSFNTAGEVCTAKAIAEYQKPSWDVPLQNIGKGGILSVGGVAAVKAARRWLRQFDIKVLNVAGNGRVDIEPIVEEFLVAVLK